MTMGMGMRGDLGPGHLEVPEGEEGANLLLHGLALLLFAAGAGRLRKK